MDSSCLSLGVGHDVVKDTNSKALKLKIGSISSHHRKPYTRTPKPASNPDQDVFRQPSLFKVKIINRFVFGNSFTQLIVGLNGLEPEILLARQDNQFAVTWEELQELKLDTQTTLSSKVGEGATLNCRFNPKPSGGDASFERVLYPYSYLASPNDEVMENFELFRYEVQQFKMQLSNIKTDAAILVDNKTVFETMYGLSVREYLSLPNAPLAPFQLYHVFEVCSSQHVYLKNSMEIDDLLCMNWEK